MASCIRIAIDMMSGDLGLRASLPAVFQSISDCKHVECVLVGDRLMIEAALSHRLLPSQLTILHAPDIVLMDDRPSHALRHKKNSSMRIAIDLLERNEVDAVVSAGNTGALMAMGCYVLKTMDGIERPAICGALPGPGRQRYLLDLGANVDSSAAQLHQFAQMGAAMCRSIDHIAEPKIGLLNIGAESTKGNEQVKLAAELLLADEGLNYQGFVEADTLFEGDVDVVVCDGFVGNVALKSCEGTAKYISRTIKSILSESVWLRCGAWVASPIFKRISQKLNTQQYNGASFLGLKGVIVKSHGNSSVESFTRAIERAVFEVESGMLQSIERQLKKTPS